MAKRFQVWGCSIVRFQSKFATMHGQVRAVVGVWSRAEAARKFRIRDDELKTYGSETGNNDEIVICTLNPRQVFLRPMSGIPREFEEDVTQDE